ncbi:acyl-CoA thioesterase [Zhihengliuella halotolerans]|uniref:Acyl-CoA thioester hydrolase n=1 Tax=Zhihengliuella halotolerans TaxID=370736 RepID=A0A4Q8A9A7_9MICC|nr:thioesterase family protein [Zhihengliuella halotolerans]RZU60657.1 acyl-CoA thioester hydrolase [Zhihengliuella halotolerans]
MTGRRLTVEVPMRWADMDAYGHINNVNLVRMMEEARIGAFGVPGGTGLPRVDPAVDLFSRVGDDTQTLVVEHRVRYVRPLDYRNVPAIVDVWVSAVKPATFELSYLFRDPVDGHECVRASTTLAFFSAVDERLLRIPAEHRDALREFLGDPLFT